MRIDARFLRTAMVLAALALAAFLAVAAVARGTAFDLVLDGGAIALPTLLAAGLLRTPLTNPRASRVAASVAALIAGAYVLLGLVQALSGGATLDSRVLLLLSLTLFSLAVLQVRLLGRVAPSKPGPGEH